MTEIVYCCEWSMDPILVSLAKPLEEQLPPKDVAILRKFYDERKALAEEMVSVPFQPTAEMRKQGFLCMTHLTSNVTVTAIWQAMIEAWKKEKNEQQPT